jgi:hypothetical protein
MLSYLLIFEDQCVLTYIKHKNNHSKANQIKLMLHKLCNFYQTETVRPCMSQIGYKLLIN